MEKRDLTNTYDQNENKEEYSLKISWESRCTRCNKEPCLMRGHTEGLDCKDYRPY